MMNALRNPMSFVASMVTGGILGAMIATPGNTGRLPVWAAALGVTALFVAEPGTRRAAAGTVTGAGAFTAVVGILRKGVPDTFYGLGGSWSIGMTVLLAVVATVLWRSHIMRGSLRDGTEQG